MRRIILGLIILAGFWLYNGGYDQLTGDGANGDPVISFENGDTEMDAAMGAARATLPRFLDNVTDANGNSVGNVSVKVAFDVGNDTSEIIWVSAFQLDGATQMSGRLANQPNYLGDLNAGVIPPKISGVQK